MSATKKSDAPRLVIGGEPRADLLPPELRQAAKGRALRRGMAALVVLVLVLVGTGYAMAFLTAEQSQHQLDAANQTTSDLLAEQAKYVEVNQVTSMLALAEIAREVGTSTEIDWKPFLARVQALLPSGTVLSVLTADSATPMAPFQPPSLPLQGDRIASLTIAASTPTLLDVKAWLESLKTLVGYVDAWPGAVTLGEGGYQLSVTIHFNQDALIDDSSEKEEPDSDGGAPGRPNETTNTTNEDR